MEETPQRRFRNELDLWKDVCPSLGSGDLDVIAEAMAAFAKSAPQGLQSWAESTLYDDSMSILQAAGRMHPLDAPTALQHLTKTYPQYVFKVQYVFEPSAAAKHFWASVAAAEKFSSTSGPSDVAVSCQFPDKDEFSPGLSPGPLSVSDTFCNRLEGWGAYWCVRLARAGLFDPADLGAGEWNSKLEAARSAIHGDDGQRTVFSKAFDIPPSLFKHGKTWSQKDLEDECLDNVQVLGWLKANCEKEKPEPMLAVSDSRGVLQAATVFKDDRKCVHVDYLASAPWKLVGDKGGVGGAGKRAIQEMAQPSADAGHGGKLELFPLEIAKGFYTHVGFTSVPGRMVLYPDAARRLLASK